MTKATSTHAPTDATDASNPVDAAIAGVKAARGAWAATSPTTRASLLEACRDCYFAVAPRMVERGLQMKGLSPTQPEAGEEWAFVTGTLKLFRAWARSLRETSTSGRPLVTGPWRTRDDPQGQRQVIVQVAPDDLAEKLSLGGGTAEVWLSPGLSLDDARAGQGARLRAPPTDPPVLALLAAGNVPMLLVGDVLHALLLRGAVVVAKLNPVNADLLPLWQEAFAPLIERGCLALIAGDAAVGARLTTHTDVDAVHMTGSHHTHDAIVFGGGAFGEVARAAGRIQNHRPLSAELGNITPVLVVPGPWTPGELRYHAIQLGSQHGLNAAFNCLTPRLVVTSSSWPQRAAFLEALRAFFAVLPTRRAYYPGAAARHARFGAAHDDAVRLGAVTEGALPWTLITGLRLDGDAAAAAQEPCFRDESFCAVLAEATVDAADAPTFLSRAVELVNERVWGNLTVTLLVHPQTAKAHKAAVDDAIARLRYGAVCVNTFGPMAYVTPSLPWGAAPGNVVTDIQSGSGVVNNVLDLPSPEKSVVRAPFTMGKSPPLNLLWPKTTPLLREVAALEHRPGWRSGLGVARALMGL